MFVLEINTAWADDYSGVYFIKSGSSNKNTPGDYYICPTKNWYLYKATNSYEDDTDNDDDNGKPFLTTYQCRNGSYDAIKAVWTIVKHPSEANCYYIIQSKTGRYVVSNGKIGTDANRMRVHLEYVADNTALSGLGDLALFEIRSHDGHIDIVPHSTDGKNGEYEFLVVNFKNFNELKGSAGKQGGPSGTYGNNTAGIIGLYNQEENHKWILEEAKLPAPTIEYDLENDKFTISYIGVIPEGFQILYTVDGSDPAPTIGGSTMEYTNESVITLATIEAHPLKAVVVRYGMILSETASLGKPANPSITPTPGDCNNTVTITSDEGTNIYYTIDGTDPTNSSTLYTGPFVLNSDATIKAVAFSGNLHSGITTYNNYSPNYSSKPTITQSGATITISGPGTFYYTTDGSEPNASSKLYNGSFTLLGNNGDVITIKAVAKDGDKNLSCVVEKTVTMGYFISNLTDLQGISSSHLDELCILTNDIDATNLSASISGFTGVFDGGYYTISGLKKPLFDNLNGATVKNVVLDPNATVSGNGAICNEAEGSTKIFNCGVLSGTVSGSGTVGGLVGHIKSGSSVRVVNCYSYADVSCTGDYAAGIVGNNEGTVASDKTVGNVRIALCMMYGSVSGATHISPVYGGNHVSNVQNFTEYNYYLYSNERDVNGGRIVKVPYTTGDYNDQLAIDKDDYLTRFPFYLHCMNTHRRLAAFFLFGESSSNNAGSISNANISEIGHWVLDKSKADYPIIEKWKTNTKKVLDAPAGTTVSDDNLGTSLAVKVIIGSNSYNASLPITDMDEANHDYTWGKVVLPFANEFEVNTDYTKICTGWKITSISSGNGASFSNYNVSDRDCTTKDLYSTTGFIFAQGGNFVVPYKVTSIEITANFATAYYLSDATYDVGYNASYGGATGLGGNVPDTFHEQTVYKSLTDVIGAMGSSPTPHSQAVVLVGNYHYSMAKKALDSYLTNGLTIMSIDEDNNQEPDYGWYSNNNADRPNMPPVRFDFLPMIPLGMAAHVTGSKGYPGIPIWNSRGWFEITETGLSIMNQFELDSGNFTGSDDNPKNYRCIINGGYFSQMIRSNNGACNKVSYFQIGGNAYIKEFYPGNHSKRTHANPLVPINVTGGEIEECFMTGYKSGGSVTGNNIYFWCAGGKIHKFLGAYMETPAANTNMTAKIDHALIGRFFGGGTSPNASISGAINVTINNSKVDFYCGGPEFSSASATPTVNTSATKTVFGEYYGAGYGGTSITYYNNIDDGNVVFDGATTMYPTYFNSYYLSQTAGRLKYKTDFGIGTCYKFEYLYHSANQQGVARFFTGYAQFSLATTGNVINVLNNCKIRKLSASETVLGKEATKGDFYGAGCQGMVNGTVTSTLTNCEIDGSAYGGGYQATSNDVDVYPTTAPSRSVFTKETGLFSEFGKVEPVVFKWVQGTDAKQNTADDCDQNGNGGKLYTSKDIKLGDLGNVTGNITLTIDGVSTIGSTTGGTLVQDSGNVFGGGNESRSLANTTVNLKGKTEVLGNVFGGGNKAIVKGTATVNIQNQD